MAQKKGNRYGVWIILILLFVGLLGFGTGGPGGSVRSIGTVGTKEISTYAYQSALREEISAYEAQYERTFTFQELQGVGVDQIVLNRIVADRALDNEATNLRLSVGDALVLDQLNGNRNFVRNGEFNREAYAYYLDQTGQSETQYEDSVREELTRGILQGAIVGGVAAPEAFAQTLLTFLTERRDVTWAQVDATALTEPLPGPTPEQLTAYYEANPDTFTLPEQREITYVWLTPAMISDTVEVDDTAVADLYQQRINEFVKPEHRLVERLVYGDEAAATAALASVTDGTSDFDALVTARGLDLADVDLGDVAQAELGEAGEGVFAAEPGDVVGPFPTNLGPALFRVNAILSAEEVPFEEAEPDLRAELANARARRVIDDARDTITDLMAGGATLEDLDERTDLKIGQISWSSEVRDDIAAYDEFRAAAAEVAEGAFPELMDLPDGGIFALRLDGVTPPTLQPQADVADALTAAWSADQSKAAILAQANVLADQLLPETPLQTLGLAAKDEPALTRRSFVEGTPPTFTSTVFEMTPGDVKVIESGANAIIIRLNGIAPPDAAEAEIAATTQTLRDTAIAGIQQDVFTVFQSEVLQRTDVAVNQGVIDAIHATLQ